MKIAVNMPQLGESIPDGEITAWLKKQGESVERDEALVEVKTDKATVEVPAPAAGTLAEILVQEGDTAEVGAKIAYIETSSEEAGASSEHPTPQTRKVETAAPPKKEPPAEAETRSAPTEPEQQRPPEPQYEQVRMTPLARRLAKELGIDPSSIEGSGAGGRITRADILAAKEEAPELKEPQQKEQPATEPKEGEEAKPLTSMRRRIASRLQQSRQTIPDVTTAIDVDMTAVAEMRAAKKQEFEKSGLKLTYMPFIMQAAVSALKAFPDVNSSWGTDKLILHKQVNLGIAVAVESGLAVPVIRDAQELSLEQLAKRLKEVGERARAGKLSSDEVSGGTFTITNPGIFGAVFSTPIINPPEAAILGVCRIADTPVARDGEVVIRKITNLCLSYDHRIIDGETALKFLGHMKEELERTETATENTER